MENWRTIKRLVSITLVLLLLLACFPSAALAWDNQNTHPEINRAALELFGTLKNRSPDLSKATLDGEVCWGIAWDPSDGTDLFYQRVANRKQKTAGDWIIMGGFSADEPEGPMALRHFYNPYPADSRSANPSHWLTDQQRLINYLNKHISRQIRNPEISLVDWAEDLEARQLDDYSLPQNYSWSDAREYFRQALQSAEPYNENYGKAWRSVGETMHLISDLALSPHVRNDGHASFLGGWLGDHEPLETGTGAEHIRRYYSSAGGWSTAINYNQDVISLMRDLARWTNRNFLSADTIPLEGRSTTANGQPVFPGPTWAGRTPDANGYIWYDVDGRRIRMVRTSAAYRWGLSTNPGYFMDKAVLNDQRSLVLPTAIRASEAVLERFLPRFSVDATVIPDPIISGRYQVHGSLIQAADPVTACEWQKYGRLKVRNGARIIVNGTDIIPVIALTDGEELNEFTREIDTGPNAVITVSYDLGGYLIR